MTVREMDEYEDSVAESAEAVFHDWSKLTIESHRLYRKHGVAPSSAADAISALAEKLLEEHVRGTSR